MTKGNANLGLMICMSLSALQSYAATLTCSFEIYGAPFVQSFIELDDDTDEPNEYARLVHYGQEQTARVTREDHNDNGWLSVVFNKNDPSRELHQRVQVKPEQGQTTTGILTNPNSPVLKNLTGPCSWTGKMP
jgi:hypothetical protein